MNPSPQSAAIAAPPAPLVNVFTPSKHFCREQRLQAEAAEMKVNMMVESDNGNLLKPADRSLCL